MPKVALYTAATVFTVLAAVQATLYVLETQILVGSTFFRPLNVLMAAILFTLLAVWMIIASLDFRSDE
jgi:hypothetical protein